MESIGGLRATGRRLRGPASDLVELDGSNGLKHTAIVFHPEYRDHNAINDALTVVLPYLENPMVTGLVELVGHDRAEGAFVYPTGTTWSVAEVNRVLADLGEAGGVRAGLELMYTAGQVLIEAADAGQHQGVYSHGGLTPWRILLRKDGQVMIVGYALPQVEILRFHEDPARVPREDSFRYCPPERIEFQAEDLSSDLFGLSLIAFELMTGKPVYDGLVNDIRQQAARGEGSRRLFRFREKLPQSVRDLLTQALRPERGDRFPSGEAFLEAVRGVLSSRDATGPSLIDLMARISTQQVRQGARPEAASTIMAPRDQLRAMVGADDEDDGEPVGGRGGQRPWSPPARRDAGGAAPAGESAPRFAAPARGEPEGRAALGASQSAPAPRFAAPQREASPAPEAPAPRFAAPQRESAPVASPPAAPVVSPPAPEAPAPRFAAPQRGPADGPRPNPRLAPAPPPPTPAAPAEDPLAALRESAARAVRRAPPRLRPAEVEEAPAPPPAPTGDPGRFSPGRRALRPDPGAPVVPEAPSPELPAPEVPGVAAGGARAPRPVPAEPGARVTAGPAPVVPAAPARGPAAEETDPELELDVSAPRVPPPRALGGLPLGVAPAPLIPPRPPAAPVVSPPAPVVSPPAAPVVSPPALAPSAAEGAPASELPWARPPEPLRPAPSAPGEPVRVTLRCGSTVLRLRSGPAVPVGELIAGLVGSRLPLRTDATGRVLGWFRAQVDGAAVEAARPVGELAEGAELVLRVVDNRLLHADVHAEESGARFLTPVGAAVPVSSLAEHFAALLGLPVGERALECGGRELPGFAILDDLGALAPLVVLRLKAPRGGRA